MKIIFTVLLLLFLNQNQSPQSEDEKKIRSILFEQSNAWNEGNLEKYMAGYWQSDSLKFIGSKGLTYGWDNTLTNYKKGYPNKEAMGKLTFEIKSLEKVGNEAFLMIGSYLVERKENLKGYFTLLWKKKKGSWVIVVDHSS